MSHPATIFLARLLALALAGGLGWVMAPQWAAASWAEWRASPGLSIPLAAALGLLAGQFFLGLLARRLRTLRKHEADQAFELEGLRGLAEGLQRERDRLRTEVETLKPAHALSSVAGSHDTLEQFLSALASVVAKNLAGARELTVYQCEIESDDPPSPRMHYRLEPGAELFLAFTPEGGDVLGSDMRDGILNARKFGVRKVTVQAHNTEYHIRADLGFTLPDRRREAVGTVLLVVPRRDPDAELSRPEAGDRLKAAVANAILDAGNVRKALTHPMPRRYDGRRKLLELACRMSTESEHYGVVVAAFEAEGVDPGEKVRVWGSLLGNAANHIAHAMRAHGFQMRAIKDGLTGLYNKSYMWEQLEEAFDRACETGTDLSVVMVDIDKFKSVNDTYGHQTGDIVLKGVADKMAQAARTSDFVFRFGGEEMGFILSGQNARKALSMANRVRKNVEETEHVGEKGEILRVTISLGVAHYTPDLDTPEALLSRADEALYHAKEHGRNMAVAWGAKKMSVRK